LRIGFAIVPAPLVPAFVRVRTLTDRGTDAFTQATLAEYMRLGLLAPHIRKMRTEYGRRRNALLEVMGRVVRHAVPLAAPGGLHMVARLVDGVDEAAAVRACRARELAVSPLRSYYAGEPRMSGLVIGFAATPVAMAGEVARRFEAALGSVVEKAV
jgi:GntR family transcriptional regulator/MocR family aminotransferase